MRDGVRAAGCARVALRDPRKTRGSGAAISSEEEKNKITPERRAPVRDIGRRRRDFGSTNRARFIATHGGKASSGSVKRSFEGAHRSFVRSRAATGRNHEANPRSFTSRARVFSSLGKTARRRRRPRRRVRLHVVVATSGVARSEVEPLGHLLQPPHGVLHLAALQAGEVVVQRLAHGSDPALLEHALLSAEGDASYGHHHHAVPVQKHSSASSTSSTLTSSSTSNPFARAMSMMDLRVMPGGWNRPAGWRLLPLDDEKVARGHLLNVLVVHRVEVDDVAVPPPSP